MNYNPFNDEPKELMSESLQESFSSDSQAQDIENIFIVVSLVLEDNSLLTGNLIGVEFGENPKIDMKVLTKKTFLFINEILKKQLNIKSIVMIHGDEVIEMPGIFKIGNLKIVEMDYQNRACVLAVDLFKIHP